MNNPNIEEEILILLKDGETSDTPVFLSFNDINYRMALDIKLYETDGPFRLPFKYKKGIEVNIGDMFHLTTITQPGRLEYKVRGLYISEMVDLNTTVTDIITCDRNHPKILLYISYKQFEKQLRITQSKIQLALRENKLSNILNK